MMKSICIIPARGGSKRIPRKNIKEFCGKPIITYSIQAALDSNIFDEVMVSTDDEEIAIVAEEYGANVPFMRSAKTSDDYASTMDVLREVIEEYKAIGKLFDSVCCLYPCAPFVTSNKLSKAEELLQISKSTKVVIPVVEYTYPVLRSFTVIDNKVEMLFPESYSARSQDLESVYHDAGQFYFMESSIINDNFPLFGEMTDIMIVSELEVQDIDTAVDWKLAEMKYKLTLTI